MMFQCAALLRHNHRTNGTLHKPTVFAYAGSSPLIVMKMRKPAIRKNAILPLWSMSNLDESRDGANSLLRWSTEVSTNKVSNDCHNDYMPHFHGESLDSSKLD